MSSKQLTLKNIVIEARASDNFINATQLCKAGGKEFKQWYRLDSAKALIQALKTENQVGTFPHQPLVEVICTGPNDQRGSWIHPDLAIQLAQWISPAFAIQVSRWIRELFTTGSVSLEESKELQAQLHKQSQEMKEMVESMERLRILNEEARDFKKRFTKDESIYIISTYSYATQGIFKIGKTKNLKARLSSHNSSHPNGDKFRVLSEFKVSDAQLTERILQNKLRGLALKNETEWFMCPFNMLVDLIEIALEEDDRLNDFVNKIIDLVSELRTQKFNTGKWTAGIDLSIFEHAEPEEMKLCGPTNIVVAQFDVTVATAEEKRAFVRECIEAYKRTIVHPREVAVLQISWKLFQEFMRQQLGIPKKRFKKLEWRDRVEQETAGDRQLAFQWRSK
jgi:uncharacterized protein YaaR (DUF327 family)